MKGISISEIARRVQVDPKTVRKYLKMQDFSLSLEKPANKASILDPYKETIDAWLAADEVEWHKQRHTAQRVHDRLGDAFADYGCSYPILQPLLRSREGERRE